MRFNLLERFDIVDEQNAAQSACTNETLDKKIAASSADTNGK
jgi:hypothetical protein